jgi:hypothetical protein
VLKLTDSKDALEKRIDKLEADTAKLKNVANNIDWDKIDPGDIGPQPMCSCSCSGGGAGAASRGVAEI